MATVTGDEVGGADAVRYVLNMSSPKSGRASDAASTLWKAHPDDAADVREAMACADRGEFLSPEATESFLKWMAGEGDESWRDELE